jgi:hypothetical protein
VVLVPARTMILRDRSRSLVVDKIAGWRWEQGLAPGGGRYLVVCAYGVVFAFQEPDASKIEAWLLKQFGPVVDPLRDGEQGTLGGT